MELFKQSAKKTKQEVEAAACAASCWASGSDDGGGELAHEQSWQQAWFMLSANQSSVSLGCERLIATNMITPVGHTHCQQLKQHMQVAPP